MITVKRYTPFVVILFVASLNALLVVPVHADADDYIFSWLVRTEIEDNYTPLPHAGTYNAADAQVYQDHYDDMYTLGRPLALMLRNETGPYDGSLDSDALDTVMSYVPRLDFVFDDFENISGFTNRDDNTLEVVSQVRGHSDSNINNARIGSYAQYPGATDLSWAYPSQTDHSGRNTFYLNSGLDVAMPNSYPYEYFETHALSSVWGSNVSPNERSALFWAPLERLSTAKRDLPKGDLLIPFVAGFVPWTGYDAAPPELEDLTAGIQHYRLRGADGYSAQGSFISGYSHSQHRQDLLSAWGELNDVFDGGTNKPQLLNLATNKTGGVEWSGAYRAGEVVVLVSNLGSGTSSVSLSGLNIYGLPSNTASVAAGEHEMFTYEIPAQDFNNDTNGSTPSLWSVRLGGGGISMGVTSAQGVGGGKALELNDPSSSHAPLYERAIMEMSEGVFDVSFYFRLDDLTQQQQIGSIRDDLLDVTALGVRGDNQRLYYMDGTTFTTAPASSGTLSEDTWYFIRQTVNLDDEEWEFYLSDVNGSQLFSATGLDLKGTGLNPDRVAFYNYSGQASHVHKMWIDHFKFDVPGPTGGGGAPEPSTLVLLVGGLTFTMARSR